MELMREQRPRRRTRKERRDEGGTDVSHDSHVTRDSDGDTLTETATRTEYRENASINTSRPDSSEIRSEESDNDDGGEAEAESNAECIGELSELKERLFEQEGMFINEKEKVIQKNAACKESVKTVFDEMRDILNKKEKELNDKIDFEFNGTEQFIDDLISSIIADKTELNDQLGKSETDSSSSTLREIKSGINSRDEVFVQLRTPDLNVNESVVEIVKHLDIGGFEDVASDNDDIEALEAEEEQDTNGDGRQNRITTGRMQVLTNLQRDDLNDLDTETPTPTNDPGNLLVQHQREDRSAEVRRSAEEDLAQPIQPEQQNWEQEEASVVRPNESVNVTEDSNHEQGDVESVSEGAIGGENVVLPTAPPLSVESVTDDPPPYWQAIGLQGPEGSKEPEIPGYYDIQHSRTILPSNKLEPWHSFPMQRQYDRRNPMPSGLVWNEDRLCLADRANQKIKFFNPNGVLTTEVGLSGYEIHDVAFLEECNGEGRYLVTCPKSKLMFIISINAYNQTKVVRKIPQISPYNCVSRGPMPQTIVGGFKEHYGKVDIFNFMGIGQILTSYSMTPINVTLQYPRSVKVHDHFVIVLDWKLRTVIVYLDTGHSVAEYRGTPSSPLCNPIDITLDHCGNILIIDGEMSNIHVIDLDCNPIEVIKLPKHFSSSPKLIAFDKASKRLAVSRSSGDVAIFTFRDGYDGVPQRRLGPQNIHEPFSTQFRQPAVLPLVEGMLPSTIENIVSRPSRNRNRQFNL